ncbi:cache domain-containing protein [Neopusillimonas aromaticivorans]|uniref:cache domain-containing protein n=1 Tax=Neopusillimonas aromaticivorans TaxID=2979868 RepID=UPI002599A5ED|nr:cache domain-containing protein [Neopusillimonas aromaticivorans]WJJ94622.1 cache domain-containing protein [Neopusillimonas aromaticivorans]
MLLTSAEGRIINNMTSFDWKGSSFDLLPEAARTTPANNTIYIGKPLIIPGQISPVLPMTLVLTDLDGKPWAFLTGFTLLYSPDFLGNLLQARLGLTGSGFLLISPEDRIFIAASNRQKVLSPTPQDGINLLHDKAMQGYRGTGITVNAQGIEEISAIVSVPYTNWFLVSAIATSEALGTVDRLRSFLLHNTVITITLLIVVMAIVVPLSLRPLTKAKRQADRMSRGLVPLEPCLAPAKAKSAC